MKKVHALLLIAFSVLFIATSCSDKDNPILKNPNTEKTEKENINLISQFVYDGLSSYYLWSDQMIDKKPTINNSDPKKYFKSVLYKTDVERRWSRITNDVESLVADFAGEPKSFGYSIGGFYQIDNVIYALIRYVFENTPASEAGIERLDLIGKINGKAIALKPGTNQISQRDIDILYGSESATFTTYKFIDNNIVESKEMEITPRKIKANPVLYNNIYEIGDKKIGYLFYTNYLSNYNDKLFEVFNHFQKEEVTDLVLDLRYNPGGDISAASYLASLFAPKTAVEEKAVLTTLSYNKFLNDYFDQNNSTRNYKLGEYQKKDRLDNKGNILAKAAPNPIDANIDLNKVYVIATEQSASASELVTFCSRAIMGESNVIHIGDTTSGKYTASWTIHPYDNKYGQPIYKEESLSASQKEQFKNWAMQPIVAIFTDKNGKSFINPGYLEPNYPLEEGFGYLNLWKPLGDKKDVFLGQALYLITGDEKYKPIMPEQTRSSRHKQIIEIKSTKDDPKPLIIDNIKLSPEDLDIIRELKRFKD